MAQVRTGKQSDILKILNRIELRLDLIEQRLAAAGGAPKVPDNTPAVSHHNQFSIVADTAELDTQAFVVPELNLQAAGKIRTDVHSAVRQICHRGNANYLTTSTSVIYPRSALWLRAAQEIVKIIAAQYRGYALGDGRTGPYYGRTVQDFQMFLADDVIDYVTVVGS